MNQLDDNQLSKILVEQSYVEEEVITAMLARAKKKEVSLGKILLSEELITKDLLGQAVAEYYQVPYADINSFRPEDSMIRAIPQEIARKYNVVIFSIKNGLLTFATDNPKDPSLLSELAKIASKSKLFADVENVRIAYSLTDDIEALFSSYEMPLQQKLEKLLANIDVPVKDLIDIILSTAYDMNATDIHFEPGVFSIVIRFRIDGVLHEIADVVVVVFPNPDQQRRS